MGVPTLVWNFENGFTGWQVGRGPNMATGEGVDLICRPLGMNPVAKEPIRNILPEFTIPVDSTKILGGRYHLLIIMPSKAGVITNAIGYMDTELREQLEQVGFGEGRRLGGVDAVANILNQMDKSMESELLGKIEESNPELAEKIKYLMFTFEDLTHLDDRGIQLLLKEISSEDLSLALRGASEHIKAKIFSNMSERAVAMLKEDLEAMGPVRLSDVEQAQVKIAMTAKRLDSEGKIVISRGDEKFV